MYYFKKCRPGILITLFLLYNSVTSIAQTITGRVYRAGTDSIIAGASVYYAGSMSGTTTDKEGNFEIKAMQQQIPVTVSCVGYFSATVNNQPGKALIVYLKPKIEVLHTVTIRADGMDRKDEVALFIREFLGTSVYAKSCTITNIDDVDLFFDSKTKTLTASCDKPLIIENKKLGYLITYYLDTFSSNTAHFLLQGNYTFKDGNISTADMAKVKRNRESVYRGSRMQFIRALWHRTLQQSGFAFFDILKPLKADDVLVTDSLQQVYISYKDKLYINYGNSPLSFLKISAEKSYIDKNGFYSTDLGWGGEISKQRVGDLLPFEYQLDSEEKGWTKLPSLTATINKADSPVTSPVEVTAKPANNAPLILEKTYLHTDRDVYFSGDTLWYKAYLVNAQNNKAANSSGNLHVELISPEAKIINSELVWLDNGMGYGDFDLPDSIPAGKYYLRAYTNWMRNFGDNFIFEKEITVLGVEAAVAVGSSSKAAVKPLATTIPVTAAKITVTAAKNTAPGTMPLLRFYPEGGSLVNGLTGIVAVKADNGSGIGINATGSILSSAGDTVAHFTCDTLGMGLFALLPVRGQTYHAVVDFIKPLRRGEVFELPLALNTGLTLQVRQRDSVIQAVISSNADLAGLTFKPVYHLVIKHAGVTIINQPIQATAQQIPVRVFTAGLPPGINAITVYDADDRPHCERLIYIHRPEKNKLTISTDKNTYQPKEQVVVQISAPLYTNLSMAAVDADLSPKQVDDITSYLMLQSEVKGNIEHVHRYFDTTNVNRYKQLDLLLMTQGWRDFIWRRLADTAIRISYAAENSIPVSGLVKDEVDNKPLPNLHVTLYAGGAIGTKMFGEQTNSSGRFNFTGLLMNGTQNVKLASVNDKGDKKGTFGIDTIRPLPVYPSILNAVEPESTDNSFRQITIEHKISDIKNSKINGITKLKEVKIKGQAPIIMRGGDILTTFGYPDQIFNIKPADDKYKTLQWYLMQLGHGIQLPSELGRWHNIIPTGIEIAGQDTSSGDTQKNLAVPKGSIGTRFRPIPPQIFVNGEELNMDEASEAEAYRTLYFSMPLHKFKKIVLKHMIGTFHGRTIPSINDPGHAVDGRDFIDRYLLYLTMNDDYMTDNPGSLSIDIPGYYQARKFYQPPPGAKPSLADFRTTIHWEPNIVTDANGKATVKFYNAVPAGRIGVVIQGLTADGIPVSSTAGFEVD